MNRSKILLLLLTIFITIAIYFLFFYRSPYQICITPRVCTMDLVQLCKDGETISTSGSCSCGIDAKVLMKFGWSSCNK